eukprot:TRINITY_DN4274_c0_g1_i1.p1 TRINITY_DN4274_c0_g1~~TRINITY_DN4274_c0_g1_i1.p1  ORF type:complete len:563 (+),score=102.35 TRINITY_DN4274_c0_g1_i1:1134-2822(+)
MGQGESKNSQPSNSQPTTPTLQSSSKSVPTTPQQTNEVTTPPHNYTLFSVEKNDLNSSQTISKEEDANNDNANNNTLSFTEPEVEKTLRLPTFFPIVYPPKGIQPDELQPYAYLSALSHMRAIFQESSQAISTTQGIVNQKIYMVNLLNDKAFGLMNKHHGNMKTCCNTFKSLEISELCAQIEETKKCMDKTVEKLNQICARLPYEHFLELGEPPIPLTASNPPKTPNNAAFPSPPFSPLLTPPSSPSTPFIVSASKYVNAKSGLTPLNNSMAQNRAISVIWQEDVIPKWSEVKSAHWVRDLWRRGVPEDLRGTIWKLAIGNQLGITQALYMSLKPNETSAIYSAVSKLIEDPSQSPSPYMTAIAMDLPRTFSQVAIKLPMPEIEFRSTLSAVLVSYSIYQPALGYVQGMSYLAAMLLIHLKNEYDTFVALSNLLNRPFMQALFQLDMPQLAPYINHYNLMLSQLLPKLHAHFETIGLDPHHYLLSWWLPLFSKSLPMSTSTRIWDLCLLEGEAYLYTVSLGIVKSLRKMLKISTLEDCRRLLTNLTGENVDQTALLKGIYE